MYFQKRERERIKKSRGLIIPVTIGNASNNFEKTDCR